MIVKKLMCAVALSSAVLAENAAGFDRLVSTGYSQDMGVLNASLIKFY